MDCDELLKQLNEYVDGNLEPGVCDEFRAHLKDCNPCQVVVDIHSRFLFERALSSEREHGVVSVDRFRTLMLDAQAEAYGDGVDPAWRHPDM